MQKVSLAVCVILTLAWRALAQVTVAVPTPRPDGTRPQGQGYGKPVFVELESIAFNGETHQRRHARTHGTLDVLEPNQYLLLREGNARVLVLLGHGLGYGELIKLVGRTTELRGIVRQIRPKQYVRGQDLDLIEDPELPVLPAPRNDWPKFSLTALGIADVETTAHRPRAAATDRDEASRILEDPGYWTGKDVRIVGLFRGRNLFGDLPASSQRDPQDWVMKDGDTAFWVTGKEPRGKGWSLDPGYKGDAVRWVEVVGKPEVANGCVYLRASKVRLTKRPGEEDPEERK